MKTKILLLAAIALLAACGHPKTAAIDLDPAQVKTMRLLVKEDTAAVAFSAAELRALTEILRTAEYDTLWNDSGIQVKMAAPDYTVVTAYRSTVEEDFLQLWAGNSRVLFAARWYLLPDGKLAEAEGLLGKIARK